MKTIALLLLIPGVALAKPEVTFVDPCTCEGNHGVARWVAKTDNEQPPSSSIIPIYPYMVLEWQPPDPLPTESSPRSEREQTWYALTGQIDKIKVEADGDVHVELSDVSGSGTSDEGHEAVKGNVVVEIPLGYDWCKLRSIVFNWVDQPWPFKVESGKTLKLRPDAPKNITVIGKCFYDVDHQDKSVPNRRPNEPDTAVWEIHPVMAIQQ